MRQRQSWEDRAEASTANYKGTPRSCSGFSCLSLHQEDLVLSQHPSFLLSSLFSLPSCTHLLPLSLLPVLPPCTQAEWLCADLTPSLWEPQYQKRVTHSGLPQAPGMRVPCRNQYQGHRR